MDFMQQKERTNGDIDMMLSLLTNNEGGKILSGKSTGSMNRVRFRGFVVLVAKERRKGLFRGCCCC